MGMRPRGAIWREILPGTGNRKCRGSEAAAFWKQHGGRCDKSLVSRGWPATCLERETELRSSGPFYVLS